MKNNNYVISVSMKYACSRMYYYIHTGVEKNIRKRILSDRTYYL